MPDPTGKTISATQVAALFDASPYVTRWMLYQHFANGISIDPEETSRMTLGLRVQKALLGQAADDLALDVTPNVDDLYLWHPKRDIGCTRDAVVHCPDRGPGALEIKTVWDYTQWMTAWGGGTPPRHVEIQLQVQMMVGDEKTPFKWGVIGACVCGEMKYWERAPMEKLWDEIESKVTKFWTDVANRREPDAFGDPAEEPLLAELFPATEPEQEQTIHDVGLGEDARMYAWAKAEAASHKKVEGSLRPRLLQAAKENGITRLPGAVLYVKKSETPPSVVTLPAQTIAHLKIFLRNSDLTEGEAKLLNDLIAWEHQTRKAGVRTTVKVEVKDDVDHATILPA